MNKSLVVAVSVLLTACASLTPAGEKVRVATAKQKEQCEFVRHISARAGMGWNKPAAALNEALNKTAEAGGNAFFIVNGESSWYDGSTLVGEALKCPT